MALDGIYLGLVKNELCSALDGARADRIYQPSREEIVINFRTRDGIKKVLFCTNASQARVHITNAEIENPKAPPMFCMLLRKHLSSGKLVGIRQDGAERILSFDFDSANELGDIVRLSLVVEIMGRRSNLMLVNGEGKILDSIKRIGQDMSSVRTVLPGALYSPPPRENRLSLFDFDKSELLEALQRAGDKDLSKLLLHTFEGISPVMAGEAVYYAAKTDSARFSMLSGEEKERLCEYFKSVSANTLQDKNRLVVLLDQGGKLKDFCFDDISRYGGLMKKRYFDSPSELLDFFYSERDRLARTKQRADDLFKLLTATDERIKRRIANQTLELSECDRQDEYRRSGELILANLYLIKKGDESAELVDYSAEDMPKVRVTLDKRLSPQQNAQKYFSEYKKCDTARKMLTARIAEGKEELKYIESVLDALTRAETEADIAALREELHEQGYIRRINSKAKPPRALPPKKFKTHGGLEVLVGRSNRQNDKLTLKDSAKTDIWFHTKDIPGSHVILKTNGKTPNDTDILEAAMIAAYHSKAYQSSSVGVDYTYVKNVKKPSGAKPGMIIFTDNKTVYVTPDREKTEELGV